MARGISFLTCVILALVAIAEIGSAKVVEICEDTRQQIVCFGGKTIHITEAIYGRKRKGNKCGLDPIFYCKARDSKLSKVRNLCEGKVICSVHVTDDNFGNPCMWSEEYMHIKYDCVAPPTQPSTIKTAPPTQPSTIKTAPPTQPSPIKTARTCENQFRFTSCPSGSVMDVKSAFYGRKSTQYCQVGDTSNTMCEKDATTFVKFYCQNKQRCFPGASSAMHGDPCPGTSKYLEFKYECIVQPVIPTTEDPVKIARTCENQFRFTSCPSGKVMDVKSGFYGRKSTQYCQVGDTSNTRCVKDVTAFVKFYCQNRQRCFPGANSAMHGDPCPGTSKYLEFAYECKDPKALTTAAPTPPIIVETTRKPLPTVSSACGKSYAAQSRIVGGKDAQAGAWPWQVAIYRNGAFICGGSLINAQWIVTATHCLENDPLPFNYEVVLGDHNRDQNEGTEVRQHIAKVIMRGDYGWDHTYNNDIALLKMVRPVIFNTRIAPVCLPDQGVQVREGTKCYVSGWGWKHYPGTAYPTLQQGMLRTVSKWECSRRLRNSPVSDQLSISDQMLCAGFNSNNPNAPDTSACRGDSGGPFVCKDYHDQWVLQGVVSWGSVRCSDRDRYSVFARVSEFKNWIDYVVRHDQQPPTQPPPTTPSNVTSVPTPGVPSGGKSTPEVQTDVPTPGVQTDVPTPGVQTDAPTPGVQTGAPTPGVPTDAPTDAPTNAPPIPPQLGFPKRPPIPGWPNNGDEPEEDLSE